MPGSVGISTAFNPTKPSLDGNTIATIDSCVFAVALIVFSVLVAAAPGASKPAAGLLSIVAPELDNTRARSSISPVSAIVCNSVEALTPLTNGLTSAACATTAIGVKYKPRVMLSMVISKSTADAIGARADKVMAITYLLALAINRFNTLFVVVLVIVLISWLLGRSSWVNNICEVSESR